VERPLNATDDLPGDLPGRDLHNLVGHPTDTGDTMTTISRTQFMQRFANGIDLNAPDLAQKLDATTLSKLKALDTNGDGLVQGSTSLGQAWRLIDGFDRNGSSASIAGTGTAADVFNALSPAAGRTTPAAGPAPTGVVSTGGSVAYSDGIKKAALDRAAADKEGYAFANAPTSPYANLSGNRTPGVSRPSWLKNNNKCNQFVGDALTQAGMKMPTFKMTDGTEHYVNAERLPTYNKHFDRITDPQQIRPGDVFVLDYPARGESTAHTEVITGYDKTTGEMKTTGAHGDGAYEMNRGKWLDSMTYDAANKRWTDPSGNHFYILRPKMPAMSGTVPIRG
jgi:hypothetical protein